MTKTVEIGVEIILLDLTLSVRLVGMAGLFYSFGDVARILLILISSCVV